MQYESQHTSLHHSSPNLHQTIRMMTFSDNNERVEGPVVNWCLSLGAIPLRRMEMRGTNDPNRHYFVLFVLANGNAFAFERVMGANQSTSTAAGESAHKDRIIAILESQPRSHLFIKIEFPEGVPEGLRFPLAVCHRIQKTNWKSHTPNSEAFAWMLTMLVARKQLPSIPNFVSSPPSPLEALCSSIYSDLQTTGKSLWEKDFAAEIKKEMQKHIVLALHHQTKTKTTSDTTPNEHTIKQIVLSSTISWVNFLATTPHRNTLSVWDTTWENTWNNEWARVWDDEWDIQDHSTNGLKTLFGKIVRPNAVDARASGRAAGRAPTDFKHVAKIVVGEQALQAEGSASQTPNSSIFIEQNSKAGQRDPTQILENNSVRKNTPNKIPIRPKECWYGEWSHFRHSRQGPAWCPAWETAAEAAWVAFWRTGEEQRDAPQPDKIAIPTTERRRKTLRDIGRAVISLLPTKRRPQHGTATEDMAKEDRILKNCPFHNLESKIVEPLANSAAEMLLASSEVDIPHLAREAFSRTENLDGTALHFVKERKEDTWVEVFIATWKRTWRNSWTAAWLAVWKSVARDALSSGLEFNNATQREPTINHEVSDAYNDICAKLALKDQPSNSLNSTGASDTSIAQDLARSPIATTSSDQAPAPAQLDIAYALQQARLMFKELEYLHRLLTRLIPTPREDIIKILRVPGAPKLDQKPIRHADLQKAYMGWLSRHIPPAHYHQYLHDVAHVWETALSRAHRMTATNSLSNTIKYPKRITSGGMSASPVASTSTRPSPFVNQRATESAEVENNA
ncbi:hypothetical protein BDV93DRAFT_516079 [Ceratobasidium sp. AG-I]|nr:hypothetical protein BDV93DRAFT_516079 [Ceratobasidium sp. AG-I]